MSNIEDAVRSLEDMFGFPLNGFIPGTIAVQGSHSLPMEALENYLSGLVGEKSDGMYKDLIYLFAIFFRKAWKVINIVRYDFY